MKIYIYIYRLGFAIASENANMQTEAGCTSNLLQLVGVTTNNVNMEIRAEVDVSKCMDNDDEIGSGKPKYQESIESRDVAKPHNCLRMLFVCVEVFRVIGEVNVRMGKDLT